MPLYFVVLIFEDNLMWGPRLRQSVTALGHEAAVISRPTDPLPAGEIAIVNLGSTVFPPEELVPALRARGTYVLAHAGHKETELHELGQRIQCDRTATNKEITFALPRLLEEAVQAIA